MNETIIFSTSNALISRIIRWVTRSRVSHVAIGITVEHVPLVLHCTTGGVQITNREEFLKDSRIVSEYRFRRDMSEGVAYALTKLGQKYDYVGLAGYAMFILAWRWFKIKMKNPLSSPTAMVCSEFVVSVDRENLIKSWENVDPEKSTPKSLLTICEKDYRNFRKL